MDGIASAGAEVTLARGEVGAHGIVTLGSRHASDSGLAFRPNGPSTEIPDGRPTPR